MPFCFVLVSVVCAATVGDTVRWGVFNELVCFQSVGDSVVLLSQTGQLRKGRGFAVQLDGGSSCIVPQRTGTSENIII